VTRPVLLLPGPASLQAAQELFGDAYECQSYLDADYAEQTAAFHANGHLKPLAGRHVDVWPIPPRARPAALGAESIVRQLLKLKCQVRVIAITEDDDQYEPRVCQLIDMSRAEVLAWARARIKVVETAPPDVPRETTRGRPRARPDGAPATGVTIDAATGSVFVSWQQLGLACYDGKPPHPTLANVQRILANHPEITGRIWFDEFHGKIFQTLFQAEPTEWADNHDTRMTVWIQNRLNLHKIGHQVVQRAVDDYARLNVRNEVREWMDSLVWDHHERLPHLMADAFGTEQNDYTAAVGRCWMVSMAARTYQPGCKVDTMPIFEGAQGMRKSSALAAIGGKWFAEMHEDITSKDFLQNLPGKLLIEISELHAFKRAEINRIKGIISCATDRYRASYGRRAEDHPRRGVWAGSVNRDELPDDETGARRFWPIACTAINLDYLRDNRMQLFAEAVYRYRAGEAWWDIDPALASAEQDARREDDVWGEVVRDYARTFSEVRIPDILSNALKLPIHQHDKAAQMRVGKILYSANYRRKTIRRGDVILKSWLKR
jgi:predicted P-loop ATPase